MPAEISNFIDPGFAGIHRQDVTVEELASSKRDYLYVFPEPQPLLTPAAKLPGTDGRKMSKSYGNTILLSEPEASMRSKLKTMVTDPARIRRTDPGNPDVCPVGDLHKIFSDAETMAKVNEGCRSAGIGCIECKGWAADNLWKVLGSDSGAPRQVRSQSEAGLGPSGTRLSQGA